jgi:hypothetical protein
LPAVWVSRCRSAQALRLLRLMSTPNCLSLR